jgi:hypothetical protein
MVRTRSLLGESWHLIQGFKKTFWLAFLYAFCIFLLMVIITSPLHFLGVKLGNSYPADFLMAILIGYFTLPAGLGIFLIALAHANNQPVHAKQIFSYYHLTIMGQVFLLTLLLIITMVLLALIPSWIVRSLLIFILGYLITVWTFSSMLVADKNLNFAAAAWLSAKAVIRHIFKIFGIYIFMSILIFISVCTLFIGFIWTGPMMVNMGVVMYHDFFN